MVVGEHAGPGEVVGAGGEVRRDRALDHAELDGVARLGALRPEEDVVVPERLGQRVRLPRRRLRRCPGRGADEADSAAGWPDMVKRVALVHDGVHGCDRADGHV